LRSDRQRSWSFRDSAGFDAAVGSQVGQPRLLHGERPPRQTHPDVDLAVGWTGNLPSLLVADVRLLPRDHNPDGFLRRHLVVVGFGRLGDCDLHAAYRLHPPMLAPWAMMTPSAPASGTSISAMTACDWFLMFTTQFSDRRPMPPKSSWVFPLISVGLPAKSEFSRPAVSSSIGKTLQRVASMSQRRCSSWSFSGIWLDKSAAWVQSFVV